MSTDKADYSSSPSIPSLSCPRCRYPLRLGGSFCSHCGHRVAGPQAIARQPAILNGQLVGSDGSYPVPAAPLRPMERVPGSNELPGALWTPRPRGGFTDSLILFKSSGPLPPLDPPAEPQPWVTPEQLPAWLEPARTFSNHQTVDISPPWLNSSGRTHPPFPDPAEMPSGPDWRSTLRRVPVPTPPEPYPPLPDNTIPCLACGVTGRKYGTDGSMQTCPVCRGKLRIPAPMPQPLPEQPPEADVTGPTDLALEAVQVASPAVTPQTTDAIPGIVEETEGPRRHLEDLLEDVAETMTGAGIQVERWADRLAASRDRLEDTVKRLDWMGSAELLVLGMTKDAVDKAVTLLQKAAHAAREAEKHLMSAEMALDVSLLHVTAWEDTWGSGSKGHE